jgi:hypothetical protein
MSLHQPVRRCLSVCQNMRPARPTKDCVKSVCLCPRADVARPALPTQDYVKWRGSLFHGVTLALADPSRAVRELAEYLLSDTFATKVSLEPLGYTGSYLVCRIGHWVPICDNTQVWTLFCDHTQDSHSRNERGDPAHRVRRSRR